MLTVPNMDDALEWRQLLKSLEILSFDEGERDGFARFDWDPLQRIPSYILDPAPPHAHPHAPPHLISFLEFLPVFCCSATCNSDQTLKVARQSCVCSPTARFSYV